MNNHDAGLERLDTEILAAHAAGATAGTLATLYRRGGDLHMNAGRSEAACFAFTQAYVYALEAGDKVLSDNLHAILKAHGRES